VFLPKADDPLPHEKINLAAMMTGSKDTKTWYQEEFPLDFYDVKGFLEGLLKGLGINGISFRKGVELPYYDPKISATVIHDNKPIAQLGKLSKKAGDAFDLKKEDIYLFEVDMMLLIHMTSGDRKFRPLTKFPAVYRDISVIVDRKIDNSKILEIIHGNGGKYLESVRLFDLYQGKGMKPGEKALAYRICYRSDQETLDGHEVNHLHESIIEKIRRETGGRLREG
jgi:phenylalanyl-tRNA synthetase beta chain